MATIKKDLRILLRDRIGLALMFGMPILLVLIVTSIQNNAFQPFSKNKLLLFVNNKDTGRFSQELIRAIDQIGLFRLEYIGANNSREDILRQMRKKDGLLTVVIPADFSRQVAAAAKEKAGKALHSFGLEGDSGKPVTNEGHAPELLYNPGIESSLKLSIAGALNGAIQMVESRQIIRTIYFSINEKPLPDSLASQMLSSRMNLQEVPVTRGGPVIPLNATQHNVPAWTIFAMFFVVMSLGSGVVREKLNGSFIRLKTLPTNYMIALLSKQITYLGVTFLQAFILFAMGVWLFPYIGLPALSLPRDGAGLVLVTLLCGWCAVSYAILVGTVARTQEQANGFGAVSVVILSIIGGLMIPSFIMPGTFQTAMQLSPLHWALQSYYGLFLEGGKLKDILINVLPLFVITVVIQLTIVAILKRKNLI
ncbi:ABC transporter permease [Flavitalea sp. BT771]|uniref:ABC transporter permease n=1 Tax=Flavitalea sp. BT771 TaxID=3063329 RepID=UPI0026E379CB|nr:ABC transporter permease [Flavitalea sp. BT771]MDV6217888.1 ABC transporter permease [Flavitalea sp. BT771]